jgi:synaptobrevin family protein YKT6
MSLFSKTVAERTKAGQRQDVEEQSYTFHAYGRSEGVAGIIISDQEYPALVAHQLLSKILDEFLSRYPKTAIAGATTLPFAQLKEYIVKYQDPHAADSIMKIQKELDETKIVLHKTIESVLERGKLLLILRLRQWEGMKLMCGFSQARRSIRWLRSRMA